MPSSLQKNHYLTGWILATSIALSSCSAAVSTASKSVVLAGTSWVPSIVGAAASNHDSLAQVTSSVLSTTTGPLLGLAQPWSGQEVTVNFSLTEDLGDGGSISLLGEVVNFPSTLSGSAYAVLTYLSDGTNDWINLTRSSGGDCFGTGAFTCSAGGSCSSNSGCTVAWPSAYVDRKHWEQHQFDFTFGGGESVNTFPTCVYTSDGTAPTTASTSQATTFWNNPTCAFSAQFLSASSNKLRQGAYTAKYVILADSYSTLTSKSAGVKVTLIKKSRSNLATAGALDVNVVLVGSAVSQASRNDKGKINLDTLFTAVHGFLSQSDVNVKLGTVTAYEWADADQYADVSTSDMGTMVSAASTFFLPESEGKSINLFLVNNISDSGSTGGVLLGISGGINGPMSNRFPNSGVVVSLFGKLDQYNSSCAASPCGMTEVDAEFADLEQTIAHEMGHYLGLNHPSESSGAVHDLLRDTPICTATTTSGGSTRISISSCLNSDSNRFPPTTKTCGQACTTYSTTTGLFCPTVRECQFNYMMYWSSKHFVEGASTEARRGDGNLFSPESGRVIHFHPLVH